MLLVVGHVYKSDPDYVRSLARTSVYINAISNRLAASSPKSQFLGMAVGNAISALVDPPDKRINFSMEGASKDKAIQYQQLTETYDVVGSLEALKPAVPQGGTPLATRKNTESQKVTRTTSNGQLGKTSKIISIQELSDDSTSEDESLPVYDRADFDEDDEEDEDPTLVQRNKPTAPV